MPRKRSTPPVDLAHRWYLAEWALYLGKTQADAQRAMGWDKASASLLWNGKQRYNQDRVDEVAAWLKIEPYELLMEPANALRIRNFWNAAHAMVAEDPPPPFEHEPTKPKRVA